VIATEDLRKTRQRVLDEVRELMVALDLAPEGVDPGATLVDELEFDSLDWLDLALRLEEDFDVALREEKLATVRTVGDVVDRVVAALREPAT
jgi:acyl carrier protein